MESPVSTLTARAQLAIRSAFGDDYAAIDPVIRRGQQSDLQADVALGLARRLKLPPRDVAQRIAAALDLSGIASKVDVGGPGFINIELDDGYLSRVVAEMAGAERLGVEPAASTETIVIDYSAPNVAKEMHVGHLRSTIIGDALSRVFEELGHRVIRQNHLGDWGTPFGMLIEHLVDLGDDSSALSIGDLDAFYREARAKFDGDPGFADRSRRRVVLLQGGDGETLVLWRHLVDESRRYFATAYERLGVKLTDADVAGESSYTPMLHDVVNALREAGILVESDGAQCVFPAGFTNKDGDPLPMIVQKQDGGFGYAATDLAAIRHRIAKLGAARVLYVIGAPQQQHLAMVFAVAKQVGWLAPPAAATHVAFGSVLGPDRKMFKTRAGGTVKLVDLLNEATQRATALVAEKNPDLEPAVREDVGRMVGIGAVKYADLSSDRVKDYVFDWSRMLAFEGNTAPYLQYAHARIRSIFRRSESIEAAPSAIAIRAPQEHALALALVGYRSAVEDVASTLLPHRLCTYLYELAIAFTRFYESCPVLKADDAATRRSRLALADVTARVLSRGLDLLGIEAPERM